MREREKPHKSSRPPVDGAEKSRTKASTSKTSSTKTSSSSAPKASSSTPKKSSSLSSSKTSSSASKTSSSASKTSSSAPKKTSSLSGSKASTSKSLSSSSKSLSSSSKTLSTSRPPKAASSSSSKSHPTLELGPEKLPSSSTKTTSSKEGRSERTSSRRVSEGKGSREPVKTERTSSRRNDKAPNSVGREPRKGERSPSRKTEKQPRPDPSNKSSTSRSRGDRKDDQGRDRVREEKSSRSQGRSKDGGITSKSNNREHTSSSRRGVDKDHSSSRSKSSSEQSSKIKSSDRGHSEKSSRKDGERTKDRSKSSKDEKNRDERGRSDGHKSSRSIEKSAVKEHRSSRKEKPVEDDDGEARDSGIEGLSIQGAMTGQASKGQEVEAVDHYQNSLETMESGISISSPRDLSCDEVEVEESISSKMVEVDEVAEEGLPDEDEEDEAMIDDDGTNHDPYMDGTFPSSSHYQNSMELSSSLMSHEELNKEGANGGADEEADDYDYEEDFEDYESDFEDDTGSGDDENDEESSSEESSSSSAGDDDDDDDETDSDADIKDPNMKAVLQAIQKENDFDKVLERVYTFDDASQDVRPLSPEEEERQDIMREIRAAATASHEKQTASHEKQTASNARPKTSRTFVNFAGAKKKQEAAQISSKMNTRGRALLSMIQLDTVSVDLLTLSPVSYEAYISSFGHSNRQQISVQTNEDALSEEVQTEEIVMRNKWTQKPVDISIGKDNQMPGPEDYMGVGGDMDPVTFSDMSRGKSNTARLTTFLNSASQVMLALLEEELVWETAESNRPNSASLTTEGLGFSQPPVSLGANVQSLLEGRSTPFVQFCPTEPSMLLSGHGFHTLDEDGLGKLGDGGLLCVWWVQEPSRPQQLLSCCSSPTCASFSPARPSLVLAGLEDGSLAAWDLREPLQLHTLRIDIDDVQWRVRVPSYVTACDESSEGEGSAIVAIHTVTTEQDNESETHGTFQVVTLTANGQVSWWVVMQVPLTSAIGNISVGRKSATTRSDGNSSAVSPHLGASPWARIAINRTASISVANTLYGEELISNDVTCHDLKLNINDPSQLFVATGSGAVAHCSRHTSRIHPKAYLPEIEPGCEALCIALCSHDYRYLLVGSSDGMVRLHSIDSEKPLTSWQSAPDAAPIQGLQWSPARPCVFYVLDSNARLHIWDLSAGDIFPVMTVEAGGLLGGTLRSFNIAPTHATSRHPLYAVFASDGGEMVLRQVGPEFGTHQLLDDYNTELERFTYYVNII